MCCRLNLSLASADVTTKFFVVVLIGLVGLLVPLQAAQETTSNESQTNHIQLKRTHLLNGEEIYDLLQLKAATRPRKHTKNFITHDPFNPPFEQAFQHLSELKYSIPKIKEVYHLNENSGEFLFRGQEPVIAWLSALATNTKVCAIRFIDNSATDYRLQTFASQQLAIEAGYVVTHGGHCGTCSSLHNLSVFLDKRDLTNTARSCGRKRNAKKIKQCLLERVDFDEHCAETWTYNILHTSDHCTSICIKYYGLWNILRDKMNKPHTDEHGNLNPCLACDENTSGPGFKYVAGRTRRNSGIISSIQRAPEELFEVDHTNYFHQTSATLE